MFICKKALLEFIVNKHFANDGQTPTDLTKIVPRKHVLKHSKQNAQTQTDSNMPPFKGPH